jgi:hypothetical protein
MYMQSEDLIHDNYMITMKYTQSKDSILNKHDQC